MDKPLKIGITSGDPAGIGPEVIQAALAQWQLFQQRSSISTFPLSSIEFQFFGPRNPREPSASFIPGQPCRRSAQAALDALEAGVQAAYSGQIEALVTGPISKKKLQEIGFSFPGQTEFLAHRTKVSSVAMCLTAPKLTVGLVTAHVPLQQVSELLSISEIVRVGTLLGQFCIQKRAIQEILNTFARAKDLECDVRPLLRLPHIAVAGFNPHAGEEGLLGCEELEIIIPALKQLQQQHPHLTFSGPHSPDTVFMQAIEQQCDAVLCMYHDQGLIPLKLCAFDTAVNVTLGLPFPRTSPDHGTAFALAGKDQARPHSCLAAIEWAVALAWANRMKSST